MLLNLSGIITTIFFNKYTILKIINEICAFATIFHLSWLISKINIIYIIEKKCNFIHLITCQLRRLLTSLFFFSGCFAYQYTIYYLYIVNENENLKNIIIKLFDSAIILLGCYIFIQSVVVFIFIYTFIVHRMKEWIDILSNENIITINHKFKEGFDTLYNESISKYNTQQFTTYWMSKSDEDIINLIPSKVSEMYNLLASKLDIDEDGQISINEFIQFTSSHNIIDYKLLWDMLSDGGQYINKYKIYDLLYKFAFLRQRFAFNLYTDYTLINWVSIYMSGFIYSGALVFISKILGYNSAFSVGIDLFKIYIITATYVSSFLYDKIRFILLMISHRPYNIGDILIYDNQPYTVTNMCPGYTSFKGTTIMTVSNILILNKPIINISNSKILDSIILKLPLNFTNCTKYIQNILEDYSISSNYITFEGIRCGWINVEDNAKILQCNWKYKIIFHDRSKYLKTKTHVLDFIISKLNDEISQKTMILQAAGGGAFNDKIKLS
jgi:hypothetical protein